jgi:hypothetical protein
MVILMPCLPRLVGSSTFQDLIFYQFLSAKKLQTLKYRFRVTSLFAVDMFRHFGPRVLKFAGKKAIFDWKIVILVFFANVNKQICK